MSQTLILNFLCGKEPASAEREHYKSTESGFNTENSEYLRLYNAVGSGFLAAWCD
jgi:hypothetical protein